DTAQLEKGPRKIHSTGRLSSIGSNVPKHLPRPQMWATKSPLTIHQMWSKVKNTLRSREARTQESLLEAVGQAWLESHPKTPSTGLPIVATPLFKML
ncbi:MAG: hypothetical protein ACREE6_11730, partial [Limisphaerales bacterium]